MINYHITAKPPVNHQDSHDEIFYYLSHFFVSVSIRCEFCHTAAQGRDMQQAGRCNIPPFEILNAKILITAWLFCCIE